MRYFTSLILFGSALAAVGIPDLARAAPGEAAIRPQTTATPVAQGSGTQVNTANLSVAITTTGKKNAKNCGKGSNDQNNGNCRPASP